jgi:UDP-N-acetylmuramyl tripeptide synthase
VARELGINNERIFDNIKNFKAAFGRAEELTVAGKHVRILLSKNPVGMNETIRAVNDIKAAGKSSTTLFVLNDRIPDGTDVSWIWDVDTEKLVALGGNFIVSGDRVYDMALRLQYSREQINTDNEQMKLIVEEDLATALDKALEMTPSDETLHILPTYSAMLEVRGLLTGRKIL